MAKASTLKFGQFLVKLGNGATPEVFAAPCGMNSRSYTMTAAINETNVPDCDDPDAPGVLQRDVVSLSQALTGAGVVADEDFDVWYTWWRSAISKNVQVMLGTRTWQGAAVLSKLSVTGTRGTRTLFDASIDSDGGWELQ